MRNKTRTFGLSVLGTLGVASLVLIGGAAPAHAANEVLSASQGGYSTVYYSTPRTNTLPKNGVYVRVTADGSDWEPKFTMAIRPTTAASNTYARTVAFKQATVYKTMFHDGTGQPYVSAGTFYVSVSIDGCMGASGTCFGEGYGYGTWSGNITWNVPVN